MSTIQVDERFDVVVLGAGLSGIGAAVHLQKNCPGKSVLVLERRDAMGGTWDLFRYPGIRSDSDMFTLGYNFKPWLQRQTIADGPLIKQYICETAQEYGVTDKIRYGHNVTQARWCSREARWQLSVETSQGEQLIKAGFLIGATGYYNYESGYQPAFEGLSDFRGQFIHPQHWPEHLDYTDKHVVVIGSGATAVTLVPELAKQAAKVTMLQRSPSYIASMPKHEAWLDGVRKVSSPSWYYRFARAWKISASFLTYRFCRYFPTLARKSLLGDVKKSLPERYDMRHFSPKYGPWDERVCAVTDGDLFEMIARGKAHMVTDTIDHFTADGVVLGSGESLNADIVVSATGLDMQFFGGIDVHIDDEPLDIHSKLCYRGVMLEDVPNLGALFGYTNASWTLKSDLTTEYLCRVINLMDKKGVNAVVARNTDNDGGGESFLDLNSGYINRAKDKLPQQGKKMPWRLYQNYFLDYLLLKIAPLQDGKLQFLTLK